VGGQVALALALLAGVGQDMPHLIERKRLGDHAQADVVAEADAGRQAGGSTGHGCCSPNRGASIAQPHAYVNSIAVSLNAVQLGPVTGNGVLRPPAFLGRSPQAKRLK
jgi:hypothetical protein